MNFSKPILLIMGLVGLVQSQDIEPNVERAARRITQQLARELPYRAAPADALALRAEGQTSPRAMRALSQGLLKEGFRIQGGDPASRHGQVLELSVATRAAGDVRMLKVSTHSLADFSVECGYGDAEWVDELGESEGGRQFLIVGPVAGTSDRALQLARQELTRRLSSRFPHLAAEDSAEAVFARQKQISFVASQGSGDGRVFQAYVAVAPDVKRLVRADAAARAAEARKPFIRFGLIGVAALASWLFYLRADLRSHGYKTTRLKFAFGSLFAALTAGIWSLPL